MMRTGGAERAPMLCRACYGVLRFIMESGAKGCEVIVSGKLRAQRAKAMKFKDGYMIASGQPVHDFIDSAVRHVLLRQGVLGIKVSTLKVRLLSGVSYEASCKGFQEPFRCVWADISDATGEILLQCCAFQRWLLVRQGMLALLCFLLQAQQSVLLWGSHALRQAG